MLPADLLLLLAVFLVEGGLQLLADQAAGHADGAGGVEDMDDGIAVVRGDLDRGVGLAGGGATDQQRHGKAFPLQFAGDMGHLIERRRNQATETNEIDILVAGGLQDFFAGHHHAQINNFVIIAGQHDAHDVFADVMDVAFDGGHEDFALGAPDAAGSFFLRFHEGQQVGDGFFHDARALDDLGQKHFARAEKVADHTHAGHERTFDDGEGPPDFLEGLGGVGFDEIDNALDEGMFEAFLDGGLAPFVLDGFGFVLLFDGFGELDQALGGVGAAVEQDVLDQFQEVLGNFLIDAEHAGVDDAHIEAGLDGVIEEGGVHRLAHGIVAAKGKGNVADAAADLGAGKVLLDPAGGVDEIDGVIVVLFQAGADGEDVWIENDVFGGKANPLGQDFISARANFLAALEVVGLALFVKSHHHDGRAITADQGGLLNEFFLAFLEADRVDDGLALDAFQAGLDDGPFRAVNHQRDARDVRFGSDQVEEPGHGLDAVEHSFVHVDINNLRAVVDLLPGHGEGFLEMAGEDQFGELGGAGDVGALANVDKVGVGADGQRLQPAQAQIRFDFGRDARRELPRRLGDGLDVRRGGPAAAADDVEPAGGGPIRQLRGEGFGRLGKARRQHGIGQSGIGISADIN